MVKNNEEQGAVSQTKLEALEGNEILLRKVIRIAEFESELDMGVNPSSFDQADTSALTEQDFEYIHKVCLRVEKRLKDLNWITKTLDEIDSKSIMRRETIRGIRFDDELYKAGRGILESFIQEKYHASK